MAQNQVQSMVGQELGSYRILSLLGTGGMGEVYLAEDTKLDRKVALKFLSGELQEDEAARRRFLREAKSAAALDHPYVCNIFEIGKAESKDFISMEYVRGKTLKEQLEKGPLPLQVALEKATEIAEALEAAHRQNIIHRDLKPLNIMITPDGHVKVLDFGLAKRLTAEGGDSQEQTLTGNLTRTGDTLGTLPYMSPEQLRGQEVDARSDIFSFGVLLYEMLTAVHPFKKDSPMDTGNATLSQDPAPLPRYVEGIPELLQHTVRKMLAKERDRRYQSAKDLRVDLEQLKRDVDRGRAAVRVSTPARKSNLRRQLALGAALLTIVLMAGVVLWLIRSPSKPSLRVEPLTSYPGHETRPTFSPEGNQVAFSWNGDKQDNFDIYVKLIGSGRPLRLTTNPAMDISPSWSPDGRSIAFLRLLPDRKVEVLLIPALGGSERPVAEINFQPFGHLPGSFLPWYPDGKWLIVCNEVNSLSVGLTLLSIGTGEKRQLTLPPMDSGVVADMAPAVSPGGDALAFIRGVSLGVSDLYLLSLSKDLKPKGEPKRLTFWNRSTNSPFWTPDGREILFSSGWHLGSRSLWEIAASGSGEPERLAALDFGAQTLAVSRQGKRLVYEQVAFDYNIWRIEDPGLEGKSAAPSKLTSSTRWDGWPDFSPDGSKIAFVSFRSGTMEVWICDSDASNAIQLTSLRSSFATDATDEIYETRGPRWSPNGGGEPGASETLSLSLARNRRPTSTSSIRTVERPSD